jgi:hypothetical protein
MTITNALPTPKNRAFQRVSNGLPTRFQRGANCLAQRLPLLRKGALRPPFGASGASIGVSARPSGSAEFASTALAISRRNQSGGSQRPFRVAPQCP